MREEVYATNSSRLESKTNSTLTILRKKNLNLEKELNNCKDVISKIRALKVKNGGSAQIVKFEERVGKLKVKLNTFQAKIREGRLKESLNIMEIKLGEEVIDLEKKKLTKKLKNTKEELEIEQKNNIGLRDTIRLKDEEINKMTDQIEESKSIGNKGVNDQEIIKRNQELHKVVQDLEKKKKDVEVQIGDIRKRYKMSYKKINEMKIEMEDKENNYNTLSQNVERLKEELKEKDTEIDHLKKPKESEEVSQLQREEYVKGLVTGNKETERLNSLLDEKKMEVEVVQIEYQKLVDKMKKLEKENQGLVLKMNLISQLHKENNVEARSFIDSMVEDPRVTEFGSHGGLRSFSFKNILTRGLKEGIFNTNILKDDQEVIPENISNENKETFSQILAANSKNNSFYESVKKREKEIVNSIPDKEVVPEFDPHLEKKNSKLTININNYNINNLKILNQSENGIQDEVLTNSLTEQNKQSQAIQPNINLRGSHSLEQNILPSKKIDFKSKLSDSFDLNIDEPKKKSEKANKSKKSYKSKSKKSEFQRMYLDDAEFSDDSSISSFQIKSSPKNSFGLERGMKEPSQVKSLVFSNPQPAKKRPSIKKILSSISDNRSKKEDLRTGNMILNESRESIHSVDNNRRSLSLDKKLHKSLFASKSKENLEECEAINTLAGKGTSFRFDELDKISVESEIDSLFGEKKVNDSGVFSEKNLNAFEQDEVIHKMMEDDDVKPGETVLAFSQRYVANQEELDKQKENGKGKDPSQANQPVIKKNLLGGNLEDKNLFDESFRNDSVMFASNTSEIHNKTLNVPGRILNPNNSFASDPLAFISGSSFGTGGACVNNILDAIKKHSEQNEHSEGGIGQNISLSKSKEPLEFKTKPRPNDLMVVPEEINFGDDLEEEFEKDFTIKLNNQLLISPKNIDNTIFDSSISLTMTNFLPNKSQSKNPEYKEKNMLDIMKDFNTGKMDQNIYDEIFKKVTETKQVSDNNRSFKEDKEKNNSFIISESGSLEEGDMLFGRKQMEESDEEKDKEDNLFNR